MKHEEPAAIRVLVANVSEVLFEVVREALAGQADLVLVGRAEGPWAALIDAGGPVDVVLLGAPGEGPPPLLGHLLQEYPDLRVIALAPAGRASILYWRGLRRRRVPLPSAAALAESIRAAARLDPTV